MQLSDLQSLVGSLANDPNHDRFALTDINTELDNTQNQWNEEIKIIKETTTLTVVDSQRQYLLTLMTGTPLAIGRVTHKGLDLDKRSKQYFDLYSNDWTQDIGTPTEFCIEATDPSNLYLTVHPTPQSGDVGANLVVEAIIAHTAMSASTDVPFMLGTSSNYLVRPYDFYLCYSVAARLLARFPSEENNARAERYLDISKDGKSNLIQVFKALESQEPKRIGGGRYWKSGNVRLLK
jgi:hypothetical protein